MYTCIPSIFIHSTGPCQGVLCACNNANCFFWPFFFFLIDADCYSFLYMILFIGDTTACCCTDFFNCKALISKMEGAICLHSRT